MGTRVGVIGAGPAGLAAAMQLARAGHDVVVVETSDLAGGLSATLRVDGFGFDFGGHRLITSNERVIRLAQDILGEELLHTRRVSRVLFQGRFWSQPLEVADALRSVHARTAAHAVLGYMAASPRRLARRSDGADHSFEDWVVVRFGRPLYELFFGPYTHKVWGVDPASIAAEWAPRRIMVGGLTSLLRALLIAEHRRPPTTTRQYYYPRLGAGQLYEGMARRCVDAGATFLYGHRAEAVQVDPGRITVRAVSGQATRDLELDALISTAPLPDLISALRPAPPREICQAAQALRYRGIIFVFVRLNRGIALGWDALYVPEPQYTFFRVEEPRLWSTGLVPPGKSSLCFEIAASPGDAAWSATDEELVATCLADFARIGFVIPAREVEGFDVARRAHVYPMHLVGTGEARERCLEWLAGLGPRLQSVGRQGAFRYLDMDESLEMGWRAAGVVNGDDPVPQMAQENRYLWDPKRQLAGS